MGLAGYPSQSCQKWQVGVAAAIASAGIEPGDLDAFTRRVGEELAHLAIYNCARYRLAIAAVERWVAAGRPGIPSTAQ